MNCPGLIAHEFIHDWALVWDMKWNDDDRLVVTTSANMTVIINPDTGQPINHFYKSYRSPYYNRAIDFSPDGNKLAIGDETGAIYIWGDTHTSEFLTERAEVTMQHGADVTDLSWNAHGKLLASAGGDGTINIWDVTDGTLIETIVVTTQTEVSSVEWSLDGDYLAYGTDDGRLVIFPTSDFTQMPQD